MLSGAVAFKIDYFKSLQGNAVLFYYLLLENLECDIVIEKQGVMVRDRI